MKAILILISHRGLRLNSGTDFGGDCRDDQGRERKERYRCFIYVIIHDNLHSSQDATRLQVTVPPYVPRRNRDFPRKNVSELDNVQDTLSCIETD
jgi:hypothetical protein